MSGLMQANKDFLTLLLTTENKQQKALIDSITPAQVDCLSEVFHNLAYVVDLEPDQYNFMKRRKNAIKALSHVQRSRKYRKSNIQKHSPCMLKVLDQVKEDLLQQLRVEPPSPTH